MSEHGFYFRGYLHIQTKAGSSEAGVKRSLQLAGSRSLVPHRIPLGLSWEMRSESGAVSPQNPDLSGWMQKERAWRRNRTIRRSPQGVKSPKRGAVCVSHLSDGEESIAKRQLKEKKFSPLSPFPGRAQQEIPFVFLLGFSRQFVYSLRLRSRKLGRWTGQSEWASLGMASRETLAAIVSWA